jgi:hypothetical protein
MFRVGTPAPDSPVPLQCLASGDSQGQLIAGSRRCERTKQRFLALRHCSSCASSHRAAPAGWNSRAAYAMRCMKASLTSRRSFLHRFILLPFSGAPGGAALFCPSLPATESTGLVIVHGGRGTPHSMAIVVQNLECVLRGGRQVSWGKRARDVPTGCEVSGSLKIESQLTPLNYSSFMPS